MLVDNFGNQFSPILVYAIPCWIGKLASSCLLSWFGEKWDGTKGQDHCGLVVHLAMAVGEW